MSTGSIFAIISYTITERAHFALRLLGILVFASLVEASFGSNIIAVNTTSDAADGDTSSFAALIARPGPDGSISLREAILAANASPGLHAITFAPSLAGQTIKLNGVELPPIVRDGTTVMGLMGPDGTPAVTIDGHGVTQTCCSGLLAVWASSVTIAQMRFVNMLGGEVAIAVRAGETGGAQSVASVRIEGNVLENDGQRGVGIWIGTEFPGTVHGQPYAGAVDATVKDVTIARNTIRRLTSDGINVGLPGTRCLIDGLLIEDNTIADNVGAGEPGLELDANYSDNQIRGTIIRRNTFSGNWAAIHINGGIAQARPDGTLVPATGNLISGTVITQNRFLSNQQAIAFNGGVGGPAATGNSTLNTDISNNLITGNTPYGAIGVGGGTDGATGNRIDGVRIVNDTIASNNGGVVLFNLSSNSIANVTVVNTLFWQNGPNDIGGQDATAVSPTVQSSLMGIDPRFAGVGDFHLLSDSPAVNAGVVTGAPTVDLEDRQRDAHPDIGAYEFAAPPRARLTVAYIPLGGTGSVKSAPQGISCPGTCSASFPQGSAVTLTVTAASGSSFGGWAGLCAGADSCAITMNADSYLTAKFTAAGPTRRRAVLHP